MRKATFLAAFLTVAAVGLGACEGPASGGGWPDVVRVGQAEVVPLLVSTELTLGQNRFLFGLLDENNEPIADAEVQLRFFDLANSESQPVSEAVAQLIHTQGTLPQYEWLYVVYVDFGRAGPWGAEFIVERPSGQTESIRVRFSVAEETLTFDIGEPVPRTRNLTVGDVGGNVRDERLTTDPNPDPAMYQMTVAEAQETGKPLVVVFATPKYCVTRTCGPMVEVVKSVRPEFAGRVNFIHVEIADVEATNAKGELVYNRFFYEWNLPTEPWTFVVDAEGRVFAKFEGVLLPDELRETLNRLLEGGR